jgi:hypothetical protein
MAIFLTAIAITIAIPLAVIFLIFCIALVAYPIDALADDEPHYSKPDKY